MTNSPNTHKIKITLYTALTFIFLIAFYSQPDFFTNLFTYFEAYTYEAWFILAIIVLPALMFTFGLAGSIFLWAVAPLYPPVISVLLLTAGALLGAYLAYNFSQYLSRDWQESLQKNKIYIYLKNKGNFWSILSLRLIPAFPHGVINFSCGILKLPLRSFLLATLVGIPPKTALYCLVIYKASQTSTPVDLYQWEIVFPLILLALAPLFFKKIIDIKATKSS